MSELKLRPPESHIKEDGIVTATQTWPDIPENASLTVDGMVLWR
jgi:hypothetical protein